MNNEDYTKLQGATEILAYKNTKVAVCTYHGVGDAEKIEKLLKEYGFQTKFADGYMIMSHCPPYFMKGVLRCWKE